MNPAHPQERANQPRMGGVKPRLEDDQMCYGCGQKNPQGLHLDFDGPRDGVLQTSVVFAKTHQGYKDIVHGGMTATVLDEVMGNLAWKEGIPAVSVELVVQFKKFVRVGERVHFEGRIEKRKRRVLYSSARAWNEAGQEVASAKGVYVIVRPSSKTLEERHR